MSEEVTPKKSFLHALANSTKRWLNNDEPIKQNLSFDQILKSFLIIIPVHAILYLYLYYSKFGTQYFLYFNPVDFLNVFYTNNFSFLIHIVFYGFIGLFFVVNFDVVARLNITTNKLILIIYFLLVLLLIISKAENNNVPFKLFFLLNLMIFTVIMLCKQTKLSFYVLVGCYFFYTIHLSEVNAITTKQNKPNFNIILSDNSFALKQDTINHKDYFIGKITDYVFIYSDSLKKVRVIPVKDIKEIQYPMVD